MTPAGIKPTTFGFVAQHINHCVAAVVHSENYIKRKYKRLSKFIAQIHAIRRALLLIPAATCSKDEVCGRSLADSGGPNHAGVVDICLLRVLCVVS
jgi:hypothetical protein